MAIKFLFLVLNVPHKLFGLGWFMNSDKTLKRSRETDECDFGLFF